MDFTGKEPLGKCPKCGAQVFDGGMNYVCEKQAGPTPTCDFRTGKIILQQEIPPEQVKKLLAEGKTDLLKNFVSNKTNRKFEAFLILRTARRHSSSRRARRRAGPSRPKPPPKIDFTGKAEVGKCPKCGGKVFDTEAGYLCEKSQAETKPCKFSISKVILEQPIDAGAGGENSRRQKERFAGQVHFQVRQAVPGVSW